MIDLTKDDDDCATIIGRAQSCLNALIKSVKDGTVTVATLQLLKQYSKQYLNLAEIIEGNTESERSFQIRDFELDYFLRLRNILDYFIQYIDIFPSGRL